MHGPSVLAALKRHEKSLEAEIARLIPGVCPDAGELLESASLGVVQVRKLLTAEVGPCASGDLDYLAELTEAIAGLLLDASRKLREAERIATIRNANAL